MVDKFLLSNFIYKIYICQWPGHILKRRKTREAIKGCRAMTRFQTIQSFKQNGFLMHVLMDPTITQTCKGTCLEMTACLLIAVSQPKPGINHLNSSGISKDDICCKQIPIIQSHTCEHRGMGWQPETCGGGLLPMQHLCHHRKILIHRCTSTKTLRTVSLNRFRNDCL